MSTTGTSRVKRKGSSLLQTPNEKGAKDDNTTGTPRAKEKGSSLLQPSNEKGTKGGNTTWVLTILFSPYKTYDYHIKTRSFVSKKLAQEAMKRVAQRIYKKSINQEGNDIYFKESSREIKFGERLNTDDYRRDFGFCKIEPTKVEDEESGEDVPSGIDDAGEDED
ncbi:10887_t:CDS:2 [Ambispora leptoticha]|uniref:10887_t:CDS:1 n=1 Tax=Ambispora leptoticha TaxID=144679 RepID=A0A9N9I8P9_9GLOM|nr:10887_t:CDS:2 [Ambispora leptoticha]